MAKLTFWGAAGTVTGSRFLLDCGNQRLLIDCGLFQGRKENRLKNWDPFPVPPESVDKLFLTHAHIDHTGFLPRFYSAGFRGSVHCTHATHELCQILLLDSAKIQMEDARWANKRGFSKHRPALPLYTVKDAEGCLQQIEGVNYGESIFSSDLRVKFKDAGHILGSAFIEIRCKRESTRESRKILFSGDLGRPDRPILRDPMQAFNVDYLVLESTYGDRLHDSNSPEDQLARVINASAEQGGVLLVPAFAVGRTQLLLFVIRELEEQGKIPSLPIYVDSPMAVDATGVFEKRKGDYDLESKVLELSGKKILQPKKLRLTRSRKESKRIDSLKGSGIVISASGMLSGGRVLHHLVRRLPKPQNTILFMGYQAEGTRGRAILDGNETVKIHGQKVPVRARVENISGFSGHADYNEILAWLMGFNRRPVRTFLVHGEEKSSQALAKKIRGRLGWEVVVPRFGESFDLDF
jgi:metallo-beta-lactamase family protein